jgi:hypothetical protein
MFNKANTVWFHCRFAAKEIRRASGRLDLPNHIGVAFGDRTYIWVGILQPQVSLGKC